MFARLDSRFGSCKLASRQAAMGATRQQVNLLEWKAERRETGPREGEMGAPVGRQVDGATTCQRNPFPAKQGARLHLLSRPSNCPVRLPLSLSLCQLAGLFAAQASAIPERDSGGCRLLSLSARRPTQQVAMSKLAGQPGKQPASEWATSERSLRPGCLRRPTLSAAAAAAAPAQRVEWLIT